MELAQPRKINKKVPILFTFPNYEYGVVRTTFYVYITFDSQEESEGKNPNFQKVEFFPELEISKIGATFAMLHILLGFFCESILVRY